MAMLGKAVEGAWIELGCSLSRTITARDHNHDEFESMMRGDDWGFARKIQEILSLCRRKEWVGSVLRDADVRLPEIEEIASWSHTVRDARNAIHFGVRPVVGNNYEKVAVLLLAAARHLQSIYLLKRIADKLVAERKGSSDYGSRP